MTDLKTACPGCENITLKEGEEVTVISSLMSVWKDKTKKESYKERQERWIRGMRIAEDMEYTKFRILRKVASYEQGWGVNWTDDMDKTIGTVVRGGILNGSFGILCQPYYYPYFVLQPVDKCVICGEPVLPGFTYGFLHAKLCKFCNSSDRHIPPEIRLAAMGSILHPDLWHTWEQDPAVIARRKEVDKTRPPERQWYPEEADKVPYCGGKILEAANPSNEIGASDYTFSVYLSGERFEVRSINAQADIKFDSEKETFVLDQYTTSATFEFAPDTNLGIIEIPLPDEKDKWELVEKRSPGWSDVWLTDDVCAKDGFFNFCIDAGDTFLRQAGCLRKCDVNHFNGQLILAEYSKQLNELPSKVLSYSIYRRKIYANKVESQSKVVEYANEWPDRHPRRVIMEGKK